MEVKETKETKENIEIKEVKENIDNKDPKENKDITESKENNEKKEGKENNENKEVFEKKEERFSQENKDLLLKIINETIKKRLDDLEKRNKAENNTVTIINKNVEKIKSMYIIYINIKLFILLNI